MKQRTDAGRSGRLPRLAASLHHAAAQITRPALAMVVALALCRSAYAVESKYAETLYTLCDALVATQISAADAPERGALVCPSTNPQEHPLHSRAGEAVYPLAIAYRDTHRAAYRDAAVLLARWMISKQQVSGAWGEDWPKHDGWKGTTADQLISLADAWPLLRAELSDADAARWRESITRAADYVATNFPMGGNINYHPTGAVGLLLAGKVVNQPPARWRAKADELMSATMAAINADGFLVGEGAGVDLGYNIAQSIGYVAMYGQLTGNVAMRRRAADMLRTHLYFVYPNGTVDNSWGTRSFKWIYESGTKTAPGVYFTFALLADLDPRFAEAGRRCLDHLVTANITHGLAGYGVHAAGHASTNPPCLYSTFTRAQSLAMAIADAAPAPVATARVALPADEPNWFRYFPSVKVAVVRTPSMMATISAYGAIARYGRGLVSRGGSLTNLWIDGFGEDGIAQTSSVTNYKREEGAHMPIESGLLPLTSRIEATIDGTYYTNLYESDATMDVSAGADHVAVTCAGTLRALDGRSSPVSYRITHRFYSDRLLKDYAITSSRDVAVRIVEPVVRQPGLSAATTGAEVRFTFPTGKRWTLQCDAARNARLTVGEDGARYWCPFPAVECVPLVLAVPVARQARVTLVLRRD